MSIEFFVALLWVFCIIGTIIEFRLENRRAKEAAEALSELMKLAKRKDAKGNAARNMLSVWASVPPSF